MQIVPRRYRRQAAVARSRVVKRLRGRELVELDEMGRGPAHAAPCPPLVALHDTFSTSGSGADVLLFGDSTSVLVSPFDLSLRSLGELVRRRLRPTRSCVVAALGYHSDVYAALLRAVRVMPQHPALVVLPVNVRQFGPEWSLNPSQQFTDVIAAADAYAADPSRPIAVVEPAMRGNLLRGDAASEAWLRFLAAPVDYPGREERTVGDFVDAVSRGHDDGNRDEWFRMIWSFHFLFPLDVHAPRFESLRAAVQSATAMGADVLVYVTPANHEAGLRLLGPAFDEALGTKVAAVRASVTAAVAGPGGADLLDWSRTLSPSDFFIDDEVLSHLNEFGRDRLADLLVEAIRERLGGARPGAR
jgi:hypothetical protein